MPLVLSTSRLTVVLVFELGPLGVRKPTVEDVEDDEGKAGSGHGNDSPSELRRSSSPLTGAGDAAIHFGLQASGVGNLMRPSARRITETGCFVDEEQGQGGLVSKA